MIKKAGVLFLVTVGLVGCAPTHLNFEGRNRPISEIEDIVSDRLEAENPGLDLEINIVEEFEQKKKKKTTH
jgi:hypothetical protein